MQKSAAFATEAWATAIELTQVSKTFIRRTRPEKRSLLHPFRMEREEIHALDGVNLSIRQGEFVAYAGPNGAGKSTTFKLLCGLLAPEAGQVRVLGLHPMQDRIALMRRCGVFFGNRSELWWDHPVISSFEWKKTVWNINPKRYGKMLAMAVELLDIQPFLHAFARELSLGQRMRADLALLLLHEPELILLDEPTLGLDVLAKRQMIDFLKSMNETEHCTILVTSHDMDDLTEMARRIVMIHQGRIAFDGVPKDLRTRAGRGRVLVLTCAGVAPTLPGAEWVQSEGDRHTYRYQIQPSAEGVAPPWMAALPSVLGLRDIETENEPIERVIADLYQGWKAEEKR